ncbi:Extended synaptotagmin-2 [Hypsibius exemplaris]|uniref:Extended synaptotagmin-2 n=1 Tax=Hypsibius exemplaris TaxID=2072580 RepID=A0A1W0X9H1_HYPEX|nr:Extended synaptotagmin-2 [Hypsibius exemplaris]
MSAGMKYQLEWIVSWNGLPPSHVLDSVRPSTAQWRVSSSSPCKMENIALNFPYLSSLPFFSGTTVAFACQVVLMCTAWVVGICGFSLWWVVLGSVGWWLAVKGKTNATNMKKAFQAQQANDQKFVRDNIEHLPSWVFFPDQERCEWFNRMLYQLWPFLNQYLVDMIIGIMEPAVNSALPAVMKFKFERITMGDEAPRIGGIKVYKEHIARGEIVLDAEILYAGDAEVKARVGPGRIGFKEITIRGTMRIIFKPLVKQMPFIGGITAFFLNTPAVDFNLTDLADVMDIPGLSELMRKVVQDQINYFLVLPNKISIPLVSDLSRYDLKFIPPDGVLRIFVAEAENLVRADIGIIGKGKSDPYCVIRVGSQIFQTQVIKDNINPNWSEYFEAVVDQASGQSLDLEVFDKDQGNTDDFLGRLNVDIYTIAKEGTVDKWFRLEDCDTGNIRLRFYWMGLSADVNSLNSVIRETAMLSEKANLATCLLMVFIESAKSLPNVRKIAAEPAPYCIASTGKDQSFRTITVKRSYDPVWESQHSFLIHAPRNEVINFSIFDEKTTKRLGWTEMYIRELLEQAGSMEMSGSFRLQNSGNNSEIRLNMRLRLLRPISLAESVATQDVDPNLIRKATERDGQQGSGLSAPDFVHDGPVSAQEFKQQAPTVGQAQQIGGHSSFSDVSFPVDLNAESELRQRGGKQQSAAIKLTLRYGEATKNLIVLVSEVVQLSKIMANGNGGHYYVSMTLMPFKTKRRTHEVVGDVDEQHYDETVEFPIDNEILMKTAYLEVKIKAKSGAFAKDAVASVIVSLEPVIGMNSYTSWYDLVDADPSK